MSSVNSNRCYLVMWPDETEAGSSTFIAAAGHGSSGAGSPVDSSIPHSPPKTLVHINGGRGSSTSSASDEGTTAVDITGHQSSQQQQPLTRIPVARLAYHPVILPPRAEYHQAEMQSKLELEADSSPIAAIRSSQATPRFVVAGSETAMLDSSGSTTAFMAVSTPNVGGGGGSGGSGQRSCCSKCLLKETENRNLRKRVQALEEQLCRAIGSKRPKIVSSLEPTLITLTPPSATVPAVPVTTLPLVQTHSGGGTTSRTDLIAATATSQQVLKQQGGAHTLLRQHQHSGLPSSGGSRYPSTAEMTPQSPANTAQLVKTDSSPSVRLIPVSSQQIHHQHTVPDSSHQSPLTTTNTISATNRPSSSTPVAGNVTRGSPHPTPTAAVEDDKIELVPSTNVFISTSKLQQILTVVKTGKQLARKLMSIYWDRSTLARSTLSASSQHYEQLDPNTISAIKTFCVLFDSSSRKSEIHSTMIDKCVQARRPRRSSLRQPGNPAPSTIGAENLTREVEDTAIHPAAVIQSTSTRQDDLLSNTSSRTVDSSSPHQIFQFTTSKDISEGSHSGTSTFLVPPLVGVQPTRSAVRDTQGATSKVRMGEETYFVISDDPLPSNKRESVEERSVHVAPPTREITKVSNIAGPFTVLGGEHGVKIDDSNREQYYSSRDTATGGDIDESSSSYDQASRVVSVGVHRDDDVPDYEGLPSSSSSRGSVHNSPTLIIHLPPIEEEGLRASSSMAEQLGRGEHQSAEGRFQEYVNQDEAVTEVEYSDNSASSDTDIDEEDDEENYLIQVPSRGGEGSEDDSVHQLRHQQHQYPSGSNTHSYNRGSEQM